MTRVRRVSLAVLVLSVAGVTSLVAPGTGAAVAQEPPTPEVTASLQPRAATLGEHVRLVVTVRHSQELLISSSEPARAEDIELLTSGVEELVFDDPIDGVAGMATTSFEFTIAAFRLGDLRPGDIEVSWLGTDGRTGSTSVRPPILRILPVRAEGDEELRPLKPQVSAGDAPAWWQGPELPIAVGVFALAAVGIVAWRRRKPAEAVPAIVLSDEASPEDRARARLDALQGLALAQPDEYRHFYGELSIAVRAYLEERFGFTATALTTGELRARYDAAGIGRWQARLVDGLLERCDAAVYARAQPDPASADHDLTVAYEIIELSRPRRRDVPEAVSA